jgi:hypothetical protein
LAVLFIAPSAGGKSWLCDEFVMKKKKEEKVGFVTNWHELLPRRQFKEVLWYHFT